MVDYAHISESELKLRELWWDDMWHFDGLTTTIPNHIQDFLRQQYLASFALMFGLAEGCMRILILYSWWLFGGVGDREIKPSLVIISGSSNLLCMKFGTHIG